MKICFSHFVSLDFSVRLYEIRIDQMISKICASLNNPQVYIPSVILRRSCKMISITVNSEPFIFRKCCPHTFIELSKSTYRISFNLLFRVKAKSYIVGIPAHSVECVTLDLGVLSSSHTLCVELP